MKTLIVMRHAKSDWSHEGLADIERPLNSRGYRDAPSMGAALVSAGFHPDLILRSPAVRTRETTAGLLEGIGRDIPVKVVDDFYPGGPAEFLEALQEHEEDADTILILAHNPGIESFAERLSGNYQRMPTAAAAVFDTPDGTVESAELVTVLRPQKR